ncbi:MAG: NADH-quinone oxidoreductase subunit M [Roseivirga sp.]
MALPLLSLILWLPIGSLVLLLLFPSAWQKAFRYVALGTTLLQGLGVAWILTNGVVTPSAEMMTDGFQWIEQVAWMHLDLGHLGVLSVNYLVGIDGLNVGLVLLSVLVLPIGVVASWNVQTHARAYFALYLLLDTLLLGSFLALDFFLFYLFFEVALLPVYFFIGLWGGPGRTQAATKFFLYTLLGTVMILVVMIGLGLSVYDPMATGQHLGVLSLNETPSISQMESLQSFVQAHALPAQDLVHSLNMVLMTDVNNFVPGAVLSPTSGALIGGQAARLVAFLGLLIGFLIKLAAVPFHTWLPDAHVEAPTPISMVLAALLLKVGGYGLLRTAYSIFPEGALYYSWGIGALGVCTIVYAALNALAMQDLKRMVAYASIAHMGYVLLGLASLTHEGINGALYQMVSHGLISSVLFLVVGILQDRVQDRQIAHFSGLANKMPHYTTVAMISFFAALGLPGLSGFVGELLVLLGAFQSSELPPWMGIVGALGVLLNAAYFVWTIQRVFLGPLSLHCPSWAAALEDLKAREYLLFVPLLLLILLLGVCPQILLHWITESVGHLVHRIHMRSLYY